MGNIDIKWGITIGALIVGSFLLAILIEYFREKRNKKRLAEDMKTIICQLETKRKSLKELIKDSDNYFNSYSIEKGDK